MLRRNTSARPDQLLDSIRAAQDTHRASVAAATAKLTDTHTAILADVINRRESIKEQVALLKAEDAGLVKVFDAVPAA